MPLVALGAAAVGAGAQIYSANKASKQQRQAAGQAAEIEATQRFQQREDQAPYRQLGAGAAQKLGSAFGIGGVGGYENRVVGTRTFEPWEVGHLLTQGLSIDDVLQQGRLGSGGKTSDLVQLMKDLNLSGTDLGRLQSGQFSQAPGSATPGGQQDFSEFYKSPGYQFQLDQGKQAIERSAAARGGLASGNTLAALTKYGTGLADQSFNTYVSQLMGLTGAGQNATNSLVSADQASTNNLANSAINGGNAQASGTIAQGNAIADFLGTAGGMFGDWLGNRKQPGADSRSSGVSRNTLIGPP